MSITQYCIENAVPIANYLVLTALLIPGTDPSMALAVVNHFPPQAIEIPSYCFDTWEKLHQVEYSTEVRDAARTCDPEQVKRLLPK